MATGWDSLKRERIRNRHGRFGGGGWGKAPGTHQPEPRASLNLYKIAHSELAVDKWTNSAWNSSVAGASAW